MIVFIYILNRGVIYICILNISANRIKQDL